MKVQSTVNNLVEWIRNNVNNAGAKGIVFGLSGGIDSAVLGALAKLAFPETTLGIIMPCHSDPIDEEHGLLVAESIGIETIKVDLSDTFDTLIKASNLSINNKLALANVKPRLRMTTLYYHGQNNNYLVAGGSNKSEFVTGYFTKHGDSGVDILPLAEFVKAEIIELARYLNIPSIIIDKPPSAGLWMDQTDEDEMGFSYQVLDNYIKTGEGSIDIIERIEKMYKGSSHKRKFPPIYKRGV